MTQFTFDVAAFRLQFPQFANATTYPDEILQAYWNTATCFVDDNDNACDILNGDCRLNALNLMTAHLAALGAILAAGGYSAGATGLVQSSSIDKIAVTLTTPPASTQWQWWMNLTPYGSELLAMLSPMTIGGLMVGGSCVRGSIKNTPSTYSPWYLSRPI